MKKKFIARGEGMVSPLLSYEIEVYTRVGLALCGTHTCRLSPTLTMTVFLMQTDQTDFFTALYFLVFLFDLCLTNRKKKDWNYSYKSGACKQYITHLPQNV